MGCVTSNMFQQIFNKYGDQLIKLMIAQKSKEKLDQKYIELTNILNQKVSIFKNKVNNLVDSKQQAIKQKFDDLKIQINQKVPGGLSALERLKGKSINQISQFDKIQKQIDQIQTTSISKVDKQKQELQKELANNKDKLRQQFQNQRPKIAVYDQLPQNLRFKIVNQAYAKFQKQISEGSEKNKQDIEKKMNLKGLDQILMNQLIYIDMSLILNLFFKFFIKLLQIVKFLDSQQCIYNLKHNYSFRQLISNTEYLCIRHTYLFIFIRHTYYIYLLDILIIQIQQFQLDDILQKLNPEAMLQKFAKDSIKKIISNLTGNKLDGILNKIL